MQGVKNIRKINSDYFVIRKISSNHIIYLSDTILSDIIDVIDYDKYIIYKSTNKFRKVTVDEFKEFKFAKYIFFDKNLYNEKDINIWLDFINYNKLNFNFLSKPFPNVSILEKIKIMN